MPYRSQNSSRNLLNSMNISESFQEIFTVTGILYIWAGELITPWLLRERLSSRDLIHPRRGVCRRGDEARPHSSYRQKHAVVFIAPEEDVYYKKLLGNFQEIKARGGRIIFITSDEGLQLPDERDRKIMIPKSPYLVSPMVSVIPAQFLAYHVANILGTDVDQPRNLAKVVTVE